MKALELWGGIECSVVRVGDRYVDENVLTGHADRRDDLDRIAALGFRTVRYPVVWERVWPDPTRAPDWSFTDERLGRLRELGIRPIVGLVHHGSGPRHTDLLSSSFVDGLASFAALVAERYPWVEDYTPVNEPLTTARFSGLYGHWYPHRRDVPSFARALLVECLGIRAAMKAIRRARPEARLVQTEDMGTIRSTELLRYQADFENQRRFLSLDLLTGRVGREHPLRELLERAGTATATLDSFVDDPCPPDIVGVNHYATSDRYLDERVDRYPARAHGGNGTHVYADIEAVRALRTQIAGFRGVIDAVWERYGLPIAITEAHLGCTPEEQIRWLVEAWEHAKSAAASGADVRAVTAWSLFGATDWNSLLTENRGDYEPGVFDVRGGVVRPTALAVVARDLATRGETDHPLAQEPGWWRRPERLLYPADGGAIPPAVTPSTQRPLVVLGAGGLIGRAIVRAAQARALGVVALRRADLDIADADRCRAMIEQLHPWAVVNAAGDARIDEAESDAEACFLRHGTSPGVLADLCRRAGARLASFSSDLVFDGTKEGPHVEDDPTAPGCVYGRAKALGETNVLDAHPGAIVFRTSLVVGAGEMDRVIATALDALRSGRPARVPADMLLSPSYLPDLADAALTLLVDGGAGRYHLASPGATSLHALVQRLARAAGVATEQLFACPLAELGLAAPRPRNRVLGTNRGALLRPLNEALEAAELSG